MGGRRATGSLSATLVLVAMGALVGAIGGGTRPKPGPAVQMPQVIELRGGLWWNGTEFEARTMYSVDGVFATRRPTAVDSVVDLAGRWIVPPYGEAHTHTIAYVRTRIADFLEDGVFYGLVMNVDRSTIAQHRSWFEGHETVDIAWTAAGVTASDGHPVQIGTRGDQTAEDVDGDWITIVESAADLDEKWPTLVEANPDLIKVFLLYADQYERRHRNPDIATRFRGMDPTLLPPLVRRAHRAGRRVAAHVRTAYDFHVAVEAGVDIVAHLPGFSMGPVSPTDLGDPDRAADVAAPEMFVIDARDARTAATRRIVVIPTIAGLGRVPDGVAPEDGRRLAEVFRIREDVLRRNLRTLRDAGVTLALGSDTGEGSVVETARVVHELGVFGEAEVLEMLVEEAPRLIFPHRRIGRLAEGYEASFLALGGDPTKDFAAVADLRLRFKEGQVLRDSPGPRDPAP